MKKETGKKNKLWLWIVIAVAAVAIIGGVVAAFVLPGMFQEEAPSGPVAEEKLYWNLDRMQWQEEGTGMSLRVPGEDGYYHISYLVDGEIVDVKVADKQLVNFLDAQDLLCLAFDEAGICVDGVPFDTYFKEVGNSLYVKRFTNATLELNSSIGMDGMNTMQPIPEGFKIFEVSEGSENKGSAITPDWLDVCSIYTDMDGNLVAIYVTAHNSIEGAEIAWAINTMNSRGYHTSPDENGVYTLQFAIDGKIQERKSRDWTVVQGIETCGSWDCSMSLEYDEEGYIIDYESVQMALRGIKLYDQAVVESVVDGHVTGTTIAGLPVDFTYDENAVIYNVCNGNCYKENEGEKVDEVFVGDRLHVYTDLDGKVVLIFKCVSHMDSPLYYRLNKTTDEDGYFVYDFAGQGKVKQYRTKDATLAAKIDSYSDKAVALELKGSIIKNAGGSCCVTGNGRAANGGFVMSVQDPVLTYINYTDPTKMNAGLMAADCEVYLVDGHYKTKMGSRAEIKQYDQIMAFKNANNELTHIFIMQRYRPGHKLAVNLSRQYAAGETTRVPNAEGYYVFDIICEGKQMQVKTKDKAMASFMDAQNYPMFGFKANKDGVISSVCAAESVFPYAVKTNNYHFVDTTANGLLETWYSNTGIDKRTSGSKFAIGSKTKIYNMDAGSIEKKLGEKTTLRRNDKVQAILRGDTGELEYIFIMDRPLAESKLYINSDSVPPIDDVPNRTPGKDGYYTLKLYCDGKAKTVRVKDPAICAQIDAAGENTPFGLTFKKGTNIVTGIYKATDTQYVLEFGPVDVKTVENDVVTVRYPGQDTDYTVSVNYDTKVIDVREGSKTFGKQISLKKGQRVRIHSAGDDVYFFVLNKPDTTPGTELKLDKNGYGECPTCGKVKWTKFDGTKSFGSADEPLSEDIHLYLPSDTDFTFGGSNMVLISGSAKVCFHLNGCKLTTNGARFWLSGGANEDAEFNLYATNGEIVYSKLSPIQQNKGNVNIYGGTYTPAGGYLPLMSLATRNVVIKDATINASLISQSSLTRFVLQGATTVHKINLEVGGKVEFDSAWTGTAIMDMQAADLSEGKVPANKAFYDGKAPSGKVTLASGEELQFKNGGLEIKYPEELKLDKNSQAECPVCKKTVTWEKYDGTKQYADINTHRHFYLAADAEYAAADANMMSIAAGGKVCFHLNSFALNAKSGQFNLTDDTAALNIVTTNGKIYYNNDAGLINQTKGKVVVNGGTYVPESKTAPFISANGNVLLNNATVKANIVSQGAAAVIELQGTTQTNKINLDNGGKVKLNSNWTGSALLDMKVSELAGGKVPVDKVSYSGKAPAGGMKLATGEILTYKDGGLVVDTSIKDVLAVDEDGYGICPVCEDDVKWTKYDGTIQYNGISDHRHFYLAEDTSYTYNSANLLSIDAGGKVCFHLNGKTLDIETAGGARMWLNGGADDGVLNLIGTKGKINYRDYPIIQQNKGTVNIIGGTYNGTGTDYFAELAARKFTITDATISGTLKGGSAYTEFILKGTTSVGKVDVAGGVVKLDSSWTGSITLSMTADDLGGEPAPVTYDKNAATPTGTVKLASGETLIYKEGELVLSQPTVPPRVAYCPACDADVEWSKYTGTSPMSSLGNPTTSHKHYYLAADVTYANGGSNMAVIGAGGSICLDLNGKTLTVNSARMWLSGGADNLSAINIIGNGGKVINSAYHFIQQDKGIVRLIGGNYSTTDGAKLVYGVNRDFYLKDATVENDITVTSIHGKLILEGATKVGKITIDNGKLELKSNWTGTATLDMDALELPDGKVPTDKVFYTGNVAPTGTLKLASGETLFYYNCGLQLTEPESEQPFDKDCPVCGDVEWIAYNGAQVISSVSAPTDTHLHYYLAENQTYTNGSSNIAVLTAGGQLCFDLNGKTLTVPSGRFWLSGGATNGVLNIFGNGGKIQYANAETMSPIQINVGTTNIEGVTFTATSGTTSFADVVGGGVLNLKDVTGGNVTVSSAVGLLKLKGATKVDKINLNGKLELDASWTGSATLNMQASDLTEGKVPADKVFYDKNAATPTGTVKLASGENLTYNNGGLELSQQPTPEQPQDVLIVDADGYGECPACKATVKWTAYDGTVQYLNITDHRHIYLTQDTSYTVNGVNLLTIGAGGSVCFHLNGKTLTVARTGGARMWLNGAASDTSTLNIFGMDGGIINYCDYPIIQQDKGIVNIYGGTYTGTNTEYFVENVARTFTIEDAAITGTVKTNSIHAKVVLKGSATVGKVDVSLDGKLELDPSWTGTATLNMQAVDLTGGKVPTDKVFYDQNAVVPTGTVTLASGETLTYNNGGLELSLIPADAQAKIEAAAAIAALNPATVIAGKTCPMCGATNVTWTEITDAAGDASGHVHWYVSGQKTVGSWRWASTVANTTVCLVLVDADMTLASPMFYTTGKGSTVNIMGNGTVVSNGTNGNSGQHGVFCAPNETTYNLYGGTYIYTGTDGSPAVRIRNNSTLNMFNDATIGKAALDTSATSANVILGHNSETGTLNMYGGTIRNSYNAPNLTLKAGSVANIYGGSIVGGNSKNAAGGNIQAQGGSTVNIYSGTVSGGKSETANADNIALLDSADKLNIFGGTVSGASGSGVSISILGGEAQIVGGEITGVVQVATVATVKNATVTGDIDLTTGNSVLTLKGAANIIGTVNFKDEFSASKVVVDTTFTGSVTLNPNDGMYLNGEFAAARAEAVGDFTGLVKLTNGDTLVNNDGQLKKAVG